MSNLQSVSNLNNQIKSLLETTFLHVNVSGEVSRITYHNSGHLYFTLKDADSSISCIMFRGNNIKMKFRLEEGMAVVLQGSVSVYAPRGSYQINCVHIEPDGQGALNLAYEQLKQKLQRKGYFENKKAIPKHIKNIALVTSATSAALQDMLRVTNKRWPLVKITIIDTIVQGESSSRIIAQNIQKADKLFFDVIVIGRGGGSIEDLWGFNEEVVADAIFNANTPIVSAVGHEIDYVISDFVADLRAPTPSAAIEMILPDKTEVLMYIDGLIEQANTNIKRVIFAKDERLNYLKKLFIAHSFEAKISLKEQEISLMIKKMQLIFSRLLETKQSLHVELLKGVDFSLNQHFRRKQDQLNALLNILENSNPQKQIKDGYAQIVKNGKKISIESLNVTDSFELHGKKEIINAQVLNKRNI